MAKINNSKINLESFLKDRVHKKIVEQLISLREWDPSEWDEAPKRHNFTHGEEAWFDGVLGLWHDGLKAWMSEREFEQAEQQEIEKTQIPDVDSALSVEFDDNKQVRLEFIDKMIKESIKKHLKVK